MVHCAKAVTWTMHSRLDYAITPRLCTHTGKECETLVGGRIAITAGFQEYWESFPNNTLLQWWGGAS